MEALLQVVKYVKVNRLDSSKESQEIVEDLGNILEKYMPINIKFLFYLKLVFD